MAATPLRRRIIGVVLAALLAVPFGGGVARAQLREQIEEAREKALAAAEASDAARERADAARREADDAAAELDRAVDALEDIEARQRVFQGRAEAAAEELDELRGSVEDLAVRRYIAAGDESPSVVAEDDLRSHVRATTIFRFVLLGGGEEIDRFRVVDEELRIVLDELAVLDVAQQDAIVELEDRNETLAQILSVMEEELALAEAKEAEFRQEVSRLEAEERRRIEAERQRRLAEQRRRAAEEAQRRAAEEAARRAAEPQQPEESGSAPTTAAPILRGNGFLCPVGGPTSFADTYGARRSGGRSHKGVDMFAPRGTPVVAPVAGTVRFRDTGLGGLAFWLDGADGHRYYGAHLNTFGQSGSVSAGTVIGTVGNTGNARFSSPHLHFEIHPNGGAAVNPTPTVRAACG